MRTLKTLLLTLCLTVAGIATPSKVDAQEKAPAKADRPAKVSLWKQQSPLKDQGRRGTCIAHSSVAALEAAYLRAGHEDIDLSEEFTIYATKNFWLEPVGPARPFATENKPAFLSGGFGSGYVHLLANGLAVPTEADMPYQPQYPEEPKKPTDLAANWFFQYEVGRFNLNPKRFDTAALSKATFYSVKTYQDISAKDTDQIEAALAAGREVVWDFDVPESVTAPGATLWDVDPKKMKTVGGHSVLIVGYDRTDPENPVFLIKNSWKGKDKVRASYEFVRRFGVDATTITAVAEPRSWEELACLGRWYVEFDGKKGVLDLYHVPGTAKTNFTKFQLRGSNGEVMVDRRLGTFFLDGDPLKAFRVNGSLHKYGVSLVIDWDTPNLKYDATGTPLRLKFSGKGKATMTGTDARAVRLKSAEAFDGKTSFADFPEVKKD
jgi:hypothetical protein